MRNSQSYITTKSCIGNDGFMCGMFDHAWLNWISQGNIKHLLSYLLTTPFEDKPLSRVSIFERNSDSV